MVLLLLILLSSVLINIIWIIFGLNVSQVYRKTFLLPINISVYPVPQNNKNHQVLRNIGGGISSVNSRNRLRNKIVITVKR